MSARDSAVAAPTKPAIHPDAALLLMGEDLDRTARAYATINVLPVEICTDEFVDALSDRVSEVVARIEAAEATTMDGLVVQVRALAWCRSDEPFSTCDRALYMGQIPTTDVRLAMVIANTLMGMTRKAA